MSIKNQNSENMKAAMKSGAKDLVQYSRNLHAAIRKKEIDDRKDLSDEESIKLIGSLVKQREESITQFKAGNREDLVAAEEAEASYLRQFLPAQLSEAEVKNFIGESIQESGAADIKDLGKVMKVLLPKIQGRADGKLVNQWVREKLGG
jgi:uncharacterized protein